MSDLTQNILDAVTVPVFVLERDSDGRMVYASFNTAAREVSGFELEKVVGKTALDIYPEPAGRIAFERHMHVATSGEPLTYEILLPFRGADHQVRTTLTPVLDDAGTVTHLVGTSHDVSRAELVSKLQANAQILKSEVEEFVSVAAHDLRSPLTKIQGIAGLLKHDFQDLGDGKLQLIEMLERVSLKSFELVAEVLSYAEVSGLEHEAVHFAYHELCTDLMSVLDPQGHHSLEQEDIWLLADRTALQIVIRNLMDNALKHADRSRVEIRITVEQVGDDLLQITARDNGKGFDDAAIALMETTRIASHSGFGLASIRRLIKTRGGTLVIETPEDGTGTAIRFTFPGRIQEPVASGMALAAPD